MKKIIIFIHIFSFCLAALGAQEVNSLYDDFLRPGAESKGYGRALTAYKGSLQAIFYNPANLAFIQDEVELMLAVEKHRLIQDIRLITAAGAYGLSRDNNYAAGLAWRRMSVKEAIDNPDSENILQLALAMKTRLFAFGVTPKVFLSSMKYQDYSGTSGGFGLDAGISMEYKKLLASISVINCFTLIRNEGTVVQKTKPFLNIGASYLLFDRLGIYLDAKSLFVENDIGLGFDISPVKVLKVFAGGSIKGDIGAGMSLKISRFVLKYGFNYSFVDKTIESSVTIGGHFKIRK